MLTWALCLVVGDACAQSPPPARPQEPAPATAGAFQDPVRLRRELLRRLDAQIEQAATKAHLEARLALDAAMPIPYLGLDADPVDGGMKVTGVYGRSGAKLAGIEVGDLVLSIDGRRTDAPAALAEAIRSNPAGTTVTVRCQRNGKEEARRCTLSPRPEEDEDEDEQFPTLAPPPGPAPKLFTADFEGVQSGTSPPDFTAVLHGHGRPGRWIAAVHEGAHVVRQDDDDPTGLRFPMLIANGFDAADVAATVRLRYAAGEIDKAGGIVLRHRDAGNYYVARVNANEGDLRIFRVSQGQRRTLPGGIAKGATNDGKWHTLEFKIEGSKLTATLDGKVTAVAYDSYFLRGGAGLWTKSDSITEFDDVKFEPLPPK